jgi:hypothetical protein
MTMGLQDLMMFRDNLQQPTPTGMDNLRNLQALTMQGMAAEDYMNEQQPMMMNTGLMSLPVAQAGFGGFVKSIARAVTRPVKAVAKGVSGLAKGVAGAVKNIAKSPIGQFAIPAAAMFLGPAAFGLPATLGGKVALASGATGLTSLVGGAKPEEALKRAAIAGALTYGGGKLFGSQSGAGAKNVTLQSGQTPSFNPNAPGAKALLDSGSYSQVGTQQAAGLGLSGAPVGTEFAGGLTGVNTAGTGLDPSVFRTYQQAAPTISGYGGTTVAQPDIAQAVYPGSGQAGGAVPEAGILDTIKDVGSSAIDRAGEAVRAGYDKFASLSPVQKGLAVAGGATLLSGLGGGQPIPQQQLAMAGLTPVETDFDKQVFTYRDAQGNILTTEEALRRIQQASQSFGPGGQQVASGVRAGFDRVDDPVLSASGGLIGMMYGGQAMPENNMDVKYKEFSGMVGGRGDGMEDNVYMPIVEGESGQQVATLAVSPKEYVVDANTMSLLGNGNPDEGAEIMDKTVKDIRKKATGQTKQQKEIDGLAALNRMRRSV